MVRERGLEPLRLTAQASKTCVSAISPLPRLVSSLKRPVTAGNGAEARKLPRMGEMVPRRNQKGRVVVLLGMLARFARRSILCNSSAAIHGLCGSRLPPMSRGMVYDLRRTDILVHPMHES